MKRILFINDTIKYHLPYIQEILDHECMKKFSIGTFYIFLRVDY